MSDKITKIYLKMNTDQNPGLLVGIAEVGFEDITYILRLIQDYLESQNKKIYYLRYWKNKNGYITVDYGSHTNFFVLEEVKKAC